MKLLHPQKLWVILKTHDDELELNGDVGLSCPTIPGLRCHICGETWANTSPVELDLPEIARNKIPSHAPLELGEYVLLRDEIAELIGLDAEGKSRLQPGCSFNPTTLICRRAVLPSVACLSGHLVVSREVVDSLETNCGLESWRWRRVPTLSAKGGKIEDRYFMLKTNGLLRPQNWAPRLVCEACGFSEWSRGSFDDFDFDAEREYRKLKVSEEITAGGDVWTLESTSYFVVSDRIYKTLTKFEPAIDGATLG